MYSNFLFFPLSPLHPLLSRFYRSFARSYITSQLNLMKLFQSSIFLGGSLSSLSPLRPNIPYHSPPRFVAAPDTFCFRISDAKEERACWRRLAPLGTFFFVPLRFCRFKPSLDILTRTTRNLLLCFSSGPRSLPPRRFGAHSDIPEIFLSSEEPHCFSFFHGSPPLLGTWAISRSASTNV